MKKSLISLIFILFIQVIFAQEETSNDENKPTEYNINARKGQFFASWGWNRSSYGKSDITFKGDGFNFELKDVKASDKPKPFGFRNFDPGGLTLPATNFQMGYFFKDNYNFVIGLDHMKYVMRQDQDVRISGDISVGNYDYENNDVVLNDVNFDGNYSGESIQLVEEFLKFEHTDGLNYIYVGINRFDNFNKFFGIRTPNFEVNLEEGVDVGVLFPKTNATVLGNERYDDFDISGFGLSASAGLNITIFKHFFIKTTFKVGYINMPDIIITKGAKGKAKQHFTFTETAYTFGYRFRFK